MAIGKYDVARGWAVGGVQAKGDRDPLGASAATEDIRHTTSRTTLRVRLTFGAKGDKRNIR